LHYTVTVDDVDYYIPETVCMIDPEDPTVDNTSAVDAFYERYEITWPGEPAITDFKTAYKEFLGIDIEADPFVRRASSEVTIKPEEDSVENYRSNIRIRQIVYP
jgi:hypothetical protein